MNRLNFTIILACLISTMCVSLPSIGQSSNEEEAQTDQLLNLTFEGGTATDYVRAIREASDAINVFVDAEAAEVHIPPIHLTNVSAAAALELLHDQRTSRDGQEIQLIYSEIIDRMTGQPIHHIHARSSSKRGTATRVWSVAAALSQNVKAEDILTAIQTALDLEATIPAQVEIRFHEATGVLIARAAHTQLIIIDETIKVVERAAKDRQGGSVQELQRTIERLQTRISELEAELAVARKP